MSAALVRKSLAIVDPDFSTSSVSGTRKKKTNKKTTIDIPEQHKLLEKLEREEKVYTARLLNSTKKLTVGELRKSKQNKDRDLKTNLKRLRLLREICKIELDKETTRQVIQRAVSRRPVLPKRKSNKNKKTVFTEEDFKRFEEDYCGEY